MRLVVFREWAKSRIGAAAALLPWGIREALLDGLVRRAGGDGVFMARLAKRSGIVSVVVDGEYGRFASAPHDETVLKWYAESGTYSPQNIAFFTAFFGDRGGTYLDIGANIGLTVVPIARDARIRCIAIEADPTNFANLRDNVRRNAPHDNVEMHQIAVFNRRATLQFGLDDSGNLGDHRIVTSSSGRKLIDVPAAALDEIVDNAAAPLAAKIDVQGAEPFVILGGQNTLAKVEALAIEFQPYHMAQLGADTSVVLDYLAGFARIAVVTGEAVSDLVFSAPSEALETLRQFVDDAAHDERRYLDVYALRAPALHE
jgi:FkbM family methyltransferase